jgi:hypothetical protein
MIRSMLLCCPLVLIASTAYPQPALPLNSLKLDLNRLKSWGMKRYIYEAGHPGSSEKAGEGRVDLKTTVGPDSIVLEDTFALVYRGKELSLHMVHRCRRDSSLSSKRIESKGEGDDELGTFVAAVDGGKAVVRMGDERQEIDVPKGTVSHYAFFRIVTLLPREKGSRISFAHWLESEELHLKKDFVVECLGRDTVAQAEKQVVCTKFCLTGGGNHPAYYWVDDESVLRQVLIDNRKWIRLREP